MKGLVEISDGPLRMPPKVAEIALIGQPRHVINGISQGFNGGLVVDGGEADGAVDDDHSPGIGEQGREVLVVNVENPFWNSEFPNQSFDQGGVLCISTFHRVLFDDQKRVYRCIMGEGADHLLNELLDMVEPRMTVDLRVASHLKGN